jgi:hypothetical protein
MLAALGQRQQQQQQQQELQQREVEQEEQGSSMLAALGQRQQQKELQRQEWSRRSEAHHCWLRCGSCSRHSSRGECRSGMQQQAGRVSLRGVGKHVGEVLLDWHGAQVSAHMHMGEAALE